jgi:hypothetical protein
VDYPRFQVAAVELASEGTPLTVANVVVGLRVGAAEAERHLDRMEQDGLVSAEIDETEGVMVYRVRGLTTSRRKETLGSSLRDAAMSSMIQQRLGASLGLGGASEKGLGVREPRKISLGVLLGGLVPGFGLAYAAPWKIVAAASLGVIVIFKILAFFPLFFAIPFYVAAAVISAVLGGLYTWQFNQSGRRLPLGNDPEVRRRLPSRFKQL